MTIEALLSDLIAAVNANTAALKAASVATGTTTTSADEGTATKSAKADKGKGDGKKADAPAAAKGGKYSKEQMTAALNEVKEKINVAAAKGLITEVGKAAKMADINDPEVIDAVYEAAKAKLEEVGDGDM